MSSKLPNFLVIGAMKSGTSSLWNSIRNHPNVFMPVKKEIEFFSVKENWERGLGWYERFFDTALQEHVAVGEASTGYTKYPAFREVPARIARTLGEIRLIYLVRDPIDRMRSQWEHAVRNWGERRSLENALDEDPTYLHFSRYATQLDQYVVHFARENILVLKSEDFKANRSAISSRVFQFIGVDPSLGPQERVQDLMVTAPRRRDPAVGALRKRGPAWRKALALVPQPARKVYRNVATRWNPPPTPKVSADLAQRLRYELRDEIGRLRPFMDDDFDGWGIA